MQGLAQARIVRVEPRLGGRFVEISHEFLMGPILRKIREILNGHPEYGRFRWAVRALDRFRDVEFWSDSSLLLGRELFEAIHEFRDRIYWDGNEWAIDLMLRSSVVGGWPVEIVRVWAQSLREELWGNDCRC